MAILADVAMHPAFAPAEIERARVQAVDGVTVAMKNPAQLAATRRRDARCSATRPMAHRFDGNARRP